MCGICGVLDRGGGRVSAELVEAMSSVLAHRGPDGSGSYVQGEIGKRRVGKECRSRWSPYH